MTGCQAGRYNRRVARAPLAVLLLALPSLAAGQAIEITPVAGLRFGGGSVNTTAQGAFQPGAGFELNDSGSFGVHVGHPIGGGEIELLYARQNTRLQTTEARWFVTILDSESERSAGRGWLDVYVGTSQVISQADLRAGLSLRF